MTAETLKPFLTPGDRYATASHSSASSVDRRGSRYFIAIAASALVILLTTTLLGLTVSSRQSIGCHHFIRQMMSDGIDVVKYKNNKEI